MKILFTATLLLCLSAHAQQTVSTDSAVWMQNIVVHVYDDKRELSKIPSAISVVGPQDLELSDQTQVLFSFNSRPGVNMEERSPGSYRISIRGSSLRAPFGVRNVKIYYYGIPFTDPGGNSYFNQLGFNNFHSAEIIKGPAGSVYGAGTGGILLLNEQDNFQRAGANVSYITGSNGLHNVSARARFGNFDMNNSLGYQHQSSDGYRHNTAMRRDVLTWDARWQAGEKKLLQAHFLYSDMFYQTPGALTLDEYKQDPKQARPGTDAAAATFYAKTVLAGFSLEQGLNNTWKNRTTLYGMYSQNRNPNLRNYSRTSEPHFGGRTVFIYTKKKTNSEFNLHAGAEYQQSYNTQRVYQNEGGDPGALQTDDEIANRQAFVFAQANWLTGNGWVFTAAASVNSNRLNFERLSESPARKEEREFKNEIAPRLAILKSVKKNISLYANVARGFSPPATSEVLPSTDVFNTSLQAESGINYELGIKASFFDNKVYVDINGFYFHLKNAIVQKRDSSGADYFENAGSANQAGVESYINYVITKKNTQFITSANAFLSHAINDFHYDDYIRQGEDFSGNTIPGIASQTIAAGISIKTKPGLYANSSLHYNGKVFLNDANLAHAIPYYYMDVKAGYQSSIQGQYLFDIFAGVQNLLDEKYSLGNDINGFGGRYYNAAPGRSFYTGVRLFYSK